MKLDDKTRKQLIESIRLYADRELEMEIGELKARLLLDYCLEEIGPSVYNQAIKDAQAFFFGKIEDLGDTCYEPELGYWTSRGPSHE
jgi:uncharacterized protein (DUF2164 family)